MTGSGAGEGFLLLGVLDRGDTPSPTLPRKREREPTAFAAAIEPDLNTLRALVYETFSARL